MTYYGEPPSKFIVDEVHQFIEATDTFEIIRRAVAARTAAVFFTEMKTTGVNYDA